MLESFNIQSHLRFGSELLNSLKLAIKKSAIFLPYEPQKVAKNG